MKKDRVRYNQVNEEKTIKTAMNEVYLRFEEAIVKAKRLGNPGLAEDLAKHRKAIIMIDYDVLADIVDRQGD